MTEASSTALTVAKADCLLCGETVPSPFTVCFRCGGSPFYGDVRGAEYSVLVEPVPGMKLRSEVAGVISSLSPGIDRADVETLLVEGQPALWVATGLSEAAARALVAKFEGMRAPARAVRGVPEAPGAARSALHPVPLGLIAAGLVLGFTAGWAYGAALIAVGIALGLLRLRRAPSRRAIAAPPLAVDPPDELEAAITRLVEAKKALDGSARQAVEGISEGARRLFLRLGDETDDVGFLAGGIQGAVGQGAGGILVAAASAAQAASGPRKADAETALLALRSTVDEVTSDLAALAANPAAEPDVAARLARNVQRLQQGALPSAK